MEVAKYEQGRQFTYIVTLRLSRATIVVVEKQCVLLHLIVCICSFRYPAWNAHALYFHLWPVRLGNIFPRFLINGAVVEKSYCGSEHKMFVLVLSTTFVW